MTTDDFEMPPETENAEGVERRVGFELEFAGLELDRAADAVVELFGGRVVADGSYRYRIVGARMGTFTLEVDARVLRDRRYLEQLRRLGIPVDEARVREPIEKVLGWMAELLVPFEVATPPIPLSQLRRVEELRAALAERQALGTGSSLRYAFGLHLNPESPALDVGTVLRHLRAFLALYGWLVESSEIDVTRSLTSFIDPFPADYRRLVLDPAYRPSMEALAADYLEHNPTRNRPLDLLPLFAHVLGKEALTALEEDELVRPRPAFHYRLPNCRIDEPGWTVAAEWNRWVEVERLAARPKALARFCSTARDEPAGAWAQIKDLTRRAFRGGES